MNLGDAAILAFVGEYRLDSACSLARWEPSSRVEII
jgi:hypothetical protein